MKTHHGLFNHMVKEYGLEMFRRELERIAAIVTEDNWQTFEEYEKLNKVGPCWIVYNDRALEAFRYRQTGYWIMSSVGWQERVADEEHITHCMDRVAPQPPEGI